MKLVSINIVLNRIADMVVDKLPISDCYDWIAIAMSYIGGQITEELKPPAVLPIENYRATFPCDLTQFQRLLEIKDDNQTINTTTVEDNRPTWIQIRDEYANQKFIVDKDNSPNPFYNDIRHSFNPLLQPESKLTWNTNIDYRIEDNTILFNIEKGSVTIQYWGVPLDKEGLPLICGDESYIEACQWFCAKQLYYRGFKFKNQEFDLKFLESKSNRYISQARAESKMPDLASLQRMYNERMRFMPITNHYYTSFKYLGVEQKNMRHGIYK